MALMPESAALTVFAIPELFLMLGLNLPDIARCTRVCKAWSRHFEPILWTDICPDRRLADSAEGTPSPPWTAALIRNLPHIRTVRLRQNSAALLRLLIQGSATDPSTRCTNLKQLSLSMNVYFERLGLFSPYLPTLLDLNPRLTHLNLSFELLLIDGVKAALSKLEHLQHLAIHAEGKFDGSETFSLLRACLPLPSLTGLFLDMEWTGCFSEKSIPDLETVINEASIARFSRNPTAAKINTLWLPLDISGGQNNPLPLLLLRSNLLDLRSCQIPWFSGSADPNEIEQVVREHCPNLKDLTCSSYMYRDQYVPAACAFIRGCSGLKSFSSGRYCKDDGMIVPTLVSQHYHTLEVFELEQGYCVRSNDLQSVLSRCTKLRRFWVMDPNPLSNGMAIEFADIGKDEWVCLDLRQLGLILNRFTPPERTLGGIIWAEPASAEEDLYSNFSFDGDSEEEDEVWPVQELVPVVDVAASLRAAAARRVYTQIGLLEKLEVLALDIDRNGNTGAKEQDYAWDLTLSKGWLRELAGLKNLKSLILHADFWSKMGQAEVEFIDEHWPLLRTIRLEGGASSWPTQAHWLWLRKRRPYLRLSPK
ncbi:unnamed protein product [Mortierella alpina]